MKLSDYEQICLDKLGQSVLDGRWSNEGLVQIIELAAGFLNLKTISDYAKANGLSYNGAKKYREKNEIAGVKFIIDNE